MPSRIIHDIIGHLIRTSEQHDIIYRNPPETELGGFYRTLTAEEQPEQVVIYRRRLASPELDDLPQDVYRELMNFFVAWHESGQGFNFGSYRQVFLTYMDSMPNPYTFGNDYRMEFKVGDDSAWRRPEPNWRSAVDGLRVSEREEYMRILMQQPRRSARIEIDPFEEVKPIRKKVEEHFDKDLFEV